jgi:hypothetical protein
LNYEPNAGKSANRTLGTHEQQSIWEISVEMKLLLVFLLFAGTALGEAMGAGSDFKGVSEQTIGLMQKGDYEGLEKLVSQIKQRGYDIRQDETELEDLYNAVLEVSGTTDAEWQDKLKQLDAWNAAIPESVTPKVALAKWHDRTAWKARGNGFANTITPFASNIMDEQMRQAVSILKSASSETVDDPEYYDEWISICLLTGPEKSVTEDYFAKGVALAKEYFPLYDSMVNYLLPRWYGAAGEADTFITTSAQGFQGDKADALYAYLTYTDTENTGGDFFKQSSLDYNRARDGFFSMMGGDQPSEWNKETVFREWQHENHLAVIACFKGDKPLMKTLFLDLQGNVQIDLFYTRKNYLSFLRRCGAQTELDKEMRRERGGAAGCRRTDTTLIHGAPGDLSATGDVL